MSTKTKKDKPATFSLDQLTKSKMFMGRVAVLMTVIGPDEMVTVAEAEKRVQKFLNREVE